MQLVASSKMKRAQNRDMAGRPYVAELTEMIVQLLDDVSLEDFTHPFMKPREIKHRGILILSTDKGLCGALNANLFRLVSKITEPALYFTIGRKATQYITNTKRNLIASFQVSDAAKYNEVIPAIRLMVDSYMEGKIDTIEIIFPVFRNTLIQTPTRQTIVPLENLKELAIAMRKNSGLPESVTDTREMIFEPDTVSLLKDLLEAFIRKSIYEAVLSTKASEHSARMVAMKTATENAEKLMEEMTLKYNKARQAAITQEILDISAASHA